jgi:hypothetical protein
MTPTQFTVFTNASASAFKMSPRVTSIIVRDPWLIVPLRSDGDGGLVGRNSDGSLGLPANAIGDHAHGLDEILRECWREGILIVGQSALQLRRNPEAAQAYHAVVVETTQGSKRYFEGLAGLGASLDAATDREGAKRAYREIIDGSPDPDLVRWAKARLAALEAPPPRDTPPPKSKAKPKGAKGG